MLNALIPQPPDKIIQLINIFRNDPREQKIDLGVGVYRDASGITPIMHAVKSAERQLLEEETTKAYTALAGDPQYLSAMRRLVLDDSVAAERVAASHTSGGTGAIRTAFELVRHASPGNSVWISNPSWPNHRSMLKYIDIPIREYRYFDEDSRSVNYELIAEDLAKANNGDAVVLHGCCHNPTGADISFEDWKRLSILLLDRGITPIIDLAYQGFGDGIREDVRGVRHFAEEFPELLIAASCSKNFGIYRERTGILLAVTPDRKICELTQGMLSHINRQSISFPPDHGARLVTMILDDVNLRSSWESELNQIRETMQSTRNYLANELQRKCGSDRFGFLKAHKGMFSLLGATADQVQLMRNRHGIYIVNDGRINVAGLNKQSVPTMAAAMLDVGM